MILMLCSTLHTICDVFIKEDCPLCHGLLHTIFLFFLNKEVNAAHALLDEFICILLIWEIYFEICQTFTTEMSFHCTIC